jgi:4'-phosphopantetheinyl transferase
VSGGGVRWTAVDWPVADVSARLVSQDAVVCVAPLHAKDAELARAKRVLCGRERDRLASYTNGVVARRFTMGRALLREVIGCALGMAPDAVPLQEGLHGKPALAGALMSRPLWFSVAHCEELFVVALSRTSDLGVDVERARSIEQWERVADRVLAPAERAQLQEAVDRGEESGHAFLRYWCRVEAELKAIGCGIVGLDDHRAGRRPLGLRVIDLDPLPLPASVAAGKARYQAALALCAPGVESARQSVLATPQLARPTIPPARASTA